MIHTFLPLQDQHALHMRYTFHSTACGISLLEQHSRYSKYSQEFSGLFLQLLLLEVFRHQRFLQKPACLLSVSLYFLKLKDYSLIDVPKTLHFIATAIAIFAQQ
jgi:hypothetical protein